MRRWSCVQFPPHRKADFEFVNYHPGIKAQDECVVTSTFLYDSSTILLCVAARFLFLFSEVPVHDTTQRRGESHASECNDQVSFQKHGYAYIPVATPLLLGDAWPSHLPAKSSSDLLECCVRSVTIGQITGAPIWTNRTASPAQPEWRKTALGRNRNKEPS